MQISIVLQKRPEMRRLMWWSWNIMPILIWWYLKQLHAVSFLNDVLIDCWFVLWLEWANHLSHHFRNGTYCSDNNRPVAQVVRFWQDLSEDPWRGFCPTANSANFRADKLHAFKHLRRALINFKHVPEHAYACGVFLRQTPTSMIFSLDHFDSCQTRRLRPC